MPLQPLHPDWPPQIIDRFTEEAQKRGIALEAYLRRRPKPPRTDYFSIAIAGSGTLFGCFCVDCLQMFPNAIIYDRSERFLNFAKQEVALGKSKFASPEFRRSAFRTEKNLNAPLKVDATLTFQRLSSVDENVMIVGRNRRQLMTFRLDATTIKAIEDIDECIRRIVLTMLTTF